jgi:hypothetical protein
LPIVARSLILNASEAAENRGLKSAQKNMEVAPMSTDFCVATNPIVEPDTSHTAELERLGDEIAELAAHLDAATARLLDLIRVSGLLGQDRRAVRVESQSSS